MFHAHHLTAPLEGVRVAGGNARSGGLTAITVKGMHPVHELVRRMRTRIDTCAAAYAPVRKVLQLGVTLPPFRIMAPETAEGTALEEYGRADAGAVVDRKPLDAENGTCPAHGVDLFYGQNGVSLENRSSKVHVRERKIKHSGFL
jgi:hypothetical protein